MRTIHSASNSMLTPVAKMRFSYSFWIAITLITLLSIAIGLFASFVIPSYMQFYDGAGLELPIWSRMVIKGRHFLWGATIFALVLWGYLWKPELAPERYTRFIRYGFLALALIDGIIIMGLLNALSISIHDQVV